MVIAIVPGFLRAIYTSQVFYRDTWGSSTPGRIIDVMAPRAPSHAISRRTEVNEANFYVFLNGGRGAPGVRQRRQNLGSEVLSSESAAIRRRRPMSYLQPSNCDISASKVVLTGYGQEPAGFTERCVCLMGAAPAAIGGTPCRAGLCMRRTCATQDLPQPLAMAASW